MTKAKFQSINSGRCVVLTQPNGEIREFHIPLTSSREGYIREGSNMGYQVCAGLSHSGNTLRATPETLLTIIRREWRAYRKTEEYQMGYDDSEL